MARVINSREKLWEDFIFVVDGKTESNVNGVNVYSYDDAIEKLKGELEVSMGIGEPAVRERLFAKLKKDGIEVVTLIHPDVYIPGTTEIGKGVTIQMGNFISCNVKIEDYVYIQPHTNIGHNDVLKKGCIVSGFCNLAGGVTVGEFTYLGISSCYKEGVTIGNYTVVGMGSAVYKDIPDEMIVMGNPARIVKKNEERHVFK